MQKVSGVYTSSFLHRDERKMALRARWIVGENLTNYEGVTCDGLASLQGGAETLLAASCYRNRDKLRKLWVSTGSKASFFYKKLSVKKSFPCPVLCHKKNIFYTYKKFCAKKSSPCPLIHFRTFIIRKKGLLRFLSHDQLTTATASSLTCEEREENVSFLRLKVTKGTDVLFWSHTFWENNSSMFFFWQWRYQSCRQVQGRLRWTSLFFNRNFNTLVWGSRELQFGP